MNFTNYFTGNGAKYKVENIILDLNQTIEHYRGKVIIQDKEVEALWDKEGRCIKLSDTRALMGNHEPGSFTLITMADIDKNNVPAGLKTRNDVSFRLHKEVRNVPGDIIRYDGEINIAGIWASTSWRPDGKSQHGTNNRADYDLVITQNIGQ